MLENWVSTYTIEEFWPSHIYVYLFYNLNYFLAELPVIYV